MVGALLQDVKSNFLLPQLYLAPGVLLVSWCERLSLFLLEAGDCSLPVSIIFWIVYALPIQVLWLWLQSFWYSPKALCKHLGYSGCCCLTKQIGFKCCTADYCRSSAKDLDKTGWFWFLWNREKYCLCLNWRDWSWHNVSLHYARVSQGRHWEQEQQYSAIIFWIVWSFQSIMK